MVIAAAQIASARGDVAGNAARHLQFAEVAAGHGVRLLVFPELSLTGYELDAARNHVIHPDDAVLSPLRLLAADARMTIVVGAPIRGERGALHIGAIAMLPDGRLSAYAKVHVHSSEAHVFECGPGGPDLEIDGFPVGLAICRDAAIPEHASAAAARGAKLYAAGVMIDAEGYARKVPLMRGYARRHGIAVLMANYSGVSGGEVSAGKSAIWGEDGEAVAESPGTEESLVIGSRERGHWIGRAVIPRI